MCIHFVEFRLQRGRHAGKCPTHNYAILGAALGFDPNGLAFSHQVHKSDGVRVADTSVTGGVPMDPVPYEADGLVTAEADLPLIIFTADCGPILLHDPVRGAIGAVHAGWRGTVLKYCRAPPSVR